MASQIGLESLPTELFMDILTQLQDLTCLANLIEASPGAYRLFNLGGHHIFEAVISSGATHKFSCALIRIIAVFRSNAFLPHVKDLSTFQTLVRRETSLLTYDDPEVPVYHEPPPEWPYPTLTIPRDISAAILHQLEGPKDLFAVHFPSLYEVHRYGVRHYTVSDQGTLLEHELIDTILNYGSQFMGLTSHERWLISSPHGESEHATLKPIHIGGIFNVLLDKGPSARSIYRHQFTNTISQIRAIPAFRVRHLEPCPDGRLRIYYGLGQTVGRNQLGLRCLEEHCYTG
ncbi:hypothetical protein BX600DRAFT_437908 [Xylariales sp. PMI_506]|nr:hypothetical protein BX600DRAFT_437908 [Xylariales sp. PMI_506]